MTEYLRIAFFIVILGGLGKTVFAQDGPVIPCTDCPEFTSNPLPQTGIWYNPQQPGTGFMLEVQGQRVAGYYYLYSEQGDPEWLLFTADLQPAQETDVAWILEADLERVHGGSCLNCPYVAPVSGAEQGQIRFEFLQRNFARFQVDDGPVHRIWTLTFGWDVTPHFAPTTDYPVPDLDGYWSLSVTDDQGMLYSRGVDLVEVQNGTGDGITIWIRELARNPSIPTPAPPAIIGELRCTESGDVQGPICEVKLDDFADDTFLMPLGNVGASRFHAESVDEFVLHAHRVGFN